ncbi:MAG: HAMP domain-containing methyl-accepting chemotaxis protein [Candidatus Omnitrophota bacterium]
MDISHKTFRIGLQLKAVISIALLIIIVASSLSFYFIRYVNQQAYEDLRKRGLSLAKNLAYNSEYGVLIANREMLSKLIDGVMKEDDVVYAITQDLEGNVLASSESGMEELGLGGKINAKAITATEPVVEVYENKNRESLYDITVPVYSIGGGFSELEMGLFSEDKELKETSKGKIGVARVGISLKNTDLLTKRITNTTIMLTLIIILISTVVTIAGVKRLIYPIKLLLLGAQNAAEGDLTQQVNIQLKDEIGQLADGFNTLIRSTHHIVGQIRNTAEKVNSSAQEMSSFTQHMNASTLEISSTIQQISKGVTTQAIRMGEISKLMDEMSGSVRQVTENAQHAAEASQQARDRAQVGGEATEETVGKMDKIAEVVTIATNLIRALNERSLQIGEITEVITKIADQTNLLALNAAIEAARAGETGRGFAVVAEEIRKLAEGSADATTKIGGLIKGIQTEIGKAVGTIEVGSKEVTSGREVVNRAGKALSEIITTVEKTAVMVTDISTAAQEQLKVTQGVVKAIEELAAIAQESSSAAQETSTSTQQQTSSMEEMTSSSEELSKMAASLANLVKRFKLKEEAEDNNKQESEIAG